jgi:hypothetical protein
VPVLRNRLRRDVGDLRAVELLEETLAVERLHLRPVQLEAVDREAPGAMLGQRALQHLLAARAPQLDLDAVLLLERLDDRHRVLEVERGVDDRALLLLRSGQHALIAVRALVQVQIAVRALGEGAAGSETQTSKNRAQPHCEAPKKERAPRARSTLLLFDSRTSS